MKTEQIPHVGPLQFAHISLEPRYFDKATDLAFGKRGKITLVNQLSKVLNFSAHPLVGSVSPW